MKKETYREWTINMKLQHHQLVQNRAQSFWHGKQLMKTSSIRSNIFQKPIATGAPPQTPLMEPKTSRSSILICRLRRTMDASIRPDLALLIAAPHEKNVKRRLCTKKSNIIGIGYPYSPILFIFCLGTPNILWLWRSKYWHSTLKRFAIPAIRLIWYGAWPILVSYTQPSLQTQFKVATFHSIHTQSSQCLTEMIPNVTPPKTWRLG